jgi:beta-lactamase class A
MASEVTGGSSLLRQIPRLAEKTEAFAVAFYDYETECGWTIHADRWFHAASTIKIPVLLGVFGAIAEDRMALNSRVHVRNRFRSVVDSEPFRVESGRDANSEVHDALGQTMKVEDLARHMIVTSSNLATNLLLEAVGLERIQQTLQSLEIRGVELLRGVEDEKAWEKGINNRVTATGLLNVCRLITEERAFGKELSRQMLDILHAQEFNSGIPAGLPKDARVAHKTGEISTVAHDAGIVYLPDREPYVLVVLTEWEASAGGRHDTIAGISRAVYEYLTEDEDA